MKSEESPRNARVLPPSLLPPRRSSSPATSISLFAVILLFLLARLFIRGSPLRPPSLYPPPLLALPRSCVLFSRLSSFRVALFGASLQKKTERTNERPAGEPHYGKYCTPAEPIFNYYATPGTSASGRGSRGNLGFGYELCATLCMRKRPTSVGIRMAQINMHAHTHTHT